MSHNITEKDHMVSTGNLVPWHGLGTVLPDNTISAEVALKEAKLEWEANLESVYDADVVEIASHRLVRRSDTRDVLGVVPKTWEPFQNRQLLEIAEALGQSGEDIDKPVIETAGSLLAGRIVWALVKLGERKLLGSAHQTYLLLSNGHSGLRGVRGTLTDVRVVCNNTLTAAEASQSHLFVTHRTGVSERVETAVHLLGWTNEATKATFALYKALAKTKTSKDTAIDVFQKIIPEDEVRKGETLASMVYSFQSGRGNEGRTAFDILNAVTDYVDHVRPFRMNDTTSSRRFDYALMGIGAKIKRGALAQTKSLAVSAGNWNS